MYFCTRKGWGKVCLIYFIAMLLVLLVYTSLTNESMTKEQRYWWWAFFITLVLTLSLLITALVIVIMSDYFAFEIMADNPEDTLPRLFPAKRTDFVMTTLNSAPVTADKVLNVQEAPTVENNQIPNLNSTSPPENDMSPSSKFINFTPLESRVTIVDMHEKTKRRPADALTASHSNRIVSRNKRI